MAEIAKLQGLEPGEISSVDGLDAGSILRVQGIDWPAGFYVLTIDVDSGNGSVWPYTGYEYLPEDEVGIYAYPSSGWSFINWIGDTSNIVNPDSSSTSLIPDLHDDTEIYAVFEKTEYHLTIDVNSGDGTVTPDDGTPYNYDSALAIEAIPGEGSIFTNWTGQTTKIVSASDPTTNLVSPLYSNATIHANFAATSGTLIYSSDSDVTLRYSKSAHTYTFYSTIANVYIGENASYSYESIVHFSSVNIPQGSTIDQVWVDVVGYTNRTGGNIYIDFSFEDSPNPTIPINSTDYRSRVTNCGINYAYTYPDPWVKESEYLLTMRFYNPYFYPYWFDSLRDCLQYLLDTYGSISSVNLMCWYSIVTGGDAGLRDWYSVNGDASKATKLKIAYHLE
jgi:hypothetical protein